MPEGDVLRELDRGHVAQLARRYDLAERGEQVGMPEHVAHRNGAIGCLGRLHDAYAVGLLQRHRLLEQHVVAGVEREQRRFDVVCVAGGDDGVVGEPPLGEELVPAGVHRIGSEPEAISEAVASGRVGICRCHDAAQLGAIEEHLGVSVVPSVARSDDNPCEAHRAIFAGGQRCGERSLRVGSGGTGIVPR